VVHEQTSARILTDREITEAVDLIVCDASFIALSKVLERPMTFTKAGAGLIALIKPQFEAGREEVGKGGVVRDAQVHQRVCTNVQSWLTEMGWTVEGLTESPIKGPEGNIEFLVAARKPS
jgi:23S rRNA (cytidine1920-2'-O)/16S rRNA (cytidine1409-2'-O)-methyltransferase